MKLIFLIFTKIFCSIELDTSEEIFYIMTDREIVGLRMKDENETDLITLEGGTATLSQNFYWDKYFPKLLIYQFNCENLYKLDTSISLDLVGVTDDDKVLFEFTLDFELLGMKLYNFVDSNNVAIYNAVYVEEDEEEDGAENIFLSREAKNVGNISATYKYIQFTEIIEPLYEKIFEYLFKYIKNTKKLAKNVKHDKKMFQQANTVEQFLCQKTIDIIKSLSKLRMPSYFTLDELYEKNKFKRAFVETLKLLIEVVDVYFKELYKDKENNDWTKEDINNHIRYQIVENTLSDCDSAYKKLFKALKGLVKFVESARLEINGNEDVEILSDCNYAKSDDFMKKYSSYILNYCTIMQNSDNIDVFYHYFSSKKLETDKKIAALVDFYADKEFACKLSGLVNKYNEGDKTDFLIFSQTEYFKSSLASRILDNFKLLKVINVPPTESEAAKKKLNELDLQEKKEKYNFLIEAEKNWESLLKKDDSSEIKTFASFLN